MLESVKSFDEGASFTAIGTACQNKKEQKEDTRTLQAPHNADTQEASPEQKDAVKYLGCSSRSKHSRKNVTVSLSVILRSNRKRKEQKKQACKEVVLKGGRSRRIVDVL